MANVTSTECVLGTLVATVRKDDFCDEIEVSLELDDGRMTTLAIVSIDRELENTGFVYSYDGETEWEAHIQRITINEDTPWF